jgi:hypothetical protein
MSNEHRNDGSWRTLMPKPDTDKFIKYTRPWPFNPTPQEDITALEAAYMAIFFQWTIGRAGVVFEDFPQWHIIKRHFTEVSE